MGRTESTKVANQGMAQSAQDQANAQQSLSKTNADLSTYSTNLSKFMKFGRATYGPNGEFMRDQNAINTSAAKAGSDALQGDLAMDAMRTGENTGNFAASVAEDQRARERDLTSNLASADATRLQKLTDINQYGVQASALPAQVQASLYGTGTSGAVGNLGPAASAAKTPGFFDEFGNSLIGAGGKVLQGLTDPGTAKG